MAVVAGLEPATGFRQRINSPAPATNSDTPQQEILVGRVGVEPTGPFGIGFTDRSRPLRDYLPKTWNLFIRYQFQKSSIF